MQLANSLAQNYFSYEIHLWNSTLSSLIVIHGSTNDLPSCHCIRLQQLCRLWRLVLGSEMPHCHIEGLFQEHADLCTRLCNT